MPGRTDPGAPGQLAAARERLARARRVVVLTGAGLAPGSGAGGACADEAPEDFFEDPVAVWRRYDAVRALLAEAGPAASHRAIAELERRAHGFTLVTLAVDGLHRLAGSRVVLELFGNLWQVRCTRCGLRSANPAVPAATLPSCPVCTGLARPDVVWRGEHLPQEALTRCFEALSTCEVLLVAGTPASRPPAAAFVEVARRAGAFVVEVVPSPPSRPSPADALLLGPLDELLPLLVS
jgi:NAD-dependent deacetylase